MRKFIVSDLHGNGDIYDSIMAYLENISMSEEVELYINGDLIDRGLDSYRMLEDVVNRINNNDSIKIHYLGGNHELMMYNALKKKKPGRPLTFLNEWIYNGGGIIESKLDSLDNEKDKINEYIEFLGNLEIYNLFDESIKNNPILLVHAQAPKRVLKKCNMKIADNNLYVYKAVWTRDRDEYHIPHKLGKKGYLTIIGHTSVLEDNGFIYNKKENYINIDGGCNPYARGYFHIDHVPVVEVFPDHLELLIWNHNNDIFNGYFFDGELYRMDLVDLLTRKIYINHELDDNGEKTRELIKKIKG